MIVLEKIKKDNLDKITNFYYNTIIGLYEQSPFYVTLFEEKPDVKKDIFKQAREYLNNLQGEYVQVDYSMKTSSRNKFVKIANPALALAEAAAAAEGGAAAAGAEMGGVAATEEASVFAKGAELFSKFPILGKIVDKTGELIKGYLKTITDIELVKRLLLLDTTLGITTKKEMFSPSAYEFLLEKSTGPRGYGDSYVSKGGYEVPSKDFLDQVEKYKKEKPELFKKKYEYYDAPETKPYEKNDAFYRVPKKLPKLLTPEEKSKIKEEKRLESLTDGIPVMSSLKFKKTAQQDGTSESDPEKEKFKNLIPNWTIDNVLNSLYRVASNASLDTQTKQAQMNQIINKYAKEIEPLDDYLKKYK